MLTVLALAMAQAATPEPPPPPMMVNPGLPVPIPAAMRSNLAAVCFVTLAEQAEERRKVGMDVAETDRVVGFYWSMLSPRSNDGSLNAALRDARQTVAAKPNSLRPACWDAHARDFERLRRTLDGRPLE